MQIMKFGIPKWPLTILGGFFVILLYCLFTFSSWALYPFPYSPMTNYLSRLGDLVYSPLGGNFYNAGCILTGIALVPFFIGLYALYADSLVEKILMIVGQVLGLCSAVALTMIGVFSEDTGAPHMLASAVFFELLFAVMILVSLALFFHPGLMKAIALYGLVIAVSDLVFSFLVGGPLVEWYAVFTALGFVALVSLSTSRTTGMTFRQTILRLYDKGHFALWGIAASVTGLVFILGAMIPYSGHNGEAYSVFNHFVSELGEIGISEAAMLFNVGLVLAGIAFIPFMIGLGLYLDSRFYVAKLAAAVGVFSSIAIIFVGIFPMNFIAQHRLSALSFFFSGMIMTGLWMIAILLQRTPRVHKLISLVGLVNVVVFAAFIFGNYGTYDIYVDRPPFWWTTTLEWAIYFAIIGFLLLMALYICRRERGNPTP